ncbi:hypothetical protein ANN_27614 [Periplaneta americana]|uniref:C2H2-type domain-containing protein n=1 Tax=Periplaneta americana TaxID=6978 RepID=A0ABQ8RWE8_PERAM|nr:hypothetical protein ANN_27614 [Periplaneta americana]
MSIKENWSVLVMQTLEDSAKLLLYFCAGSNIATSTSKAEFIAASEAVKETISLVMMDVMESEHDIDPLMVLTIVNTDTEVEKPFLQVEKFKYLGATVTNINDTREEIKRRINMGNACYYSVEKLLSSSLLSKNLKVRIYKTVILPVLLYGCDTWTLTLREEHRLRVFENKVLRKIFGAKRDEVTGELRKLHNTELHALYSSPDIIRNIKSRRLRWAGHVARMGKSRNAYRVLVGRPEGKRSLGRPRRRWEDNIKMDLRELGYDDNDWINLAQDRDRWRGYVRATLNLRFTFHVFSSQEDVSDVDRVKDELKSKTSGEDDVSTTSINTGLSPENYDIADEEPHPTDLLPSEKSTRLSIDECRDFDELLEEEDNMTTLSIGVETAAKTSRDEALTNCDVLSTSVLESHVGHHASEKPFKCNLCNESFSQAGDLKRHSRLHAGEKSFKCNVCGKCFPDSGKLVNHSRAHTGEKPFKCDECGRCFSQKGDLKSHSRYHTGDAPYICDACGKCFRKPGHLKTHSRQHTGLKALKCKVCEKSFSQFEQLKRHATLHKRNLPLKCDVCGKSFSRAGLLRKHLYFHTDERPFNCDVCGKGFKRWWHLQTHARLHTGDKPFKCEVCGKGFTQSSNLKTHSRLHTGEKPFSCNVCGKSFTNSGEHKIHALSHSGERPFKCDVCGKSFLRCGHLKDHARLHSGEKAFKCDTCGKCFAIRKNLTRHERVHTGEKPYKCDQCEQSFSQSQSLKMHQYTKH